MCEWGHSPSLPAIIGKSGLITFSVKSAKFSLCSRSPSGQTCLGLVQARGSQSAQAGGIQLVIPFHSAEAPGGFRKRPAEQPDQ